MQTEISPYDISGFLLAYFPFGMRGQNLQDALFRMLQTLTVTERQMCTLFIAFTCLLRS